WSWWGVASSKAQVAARLGHQAHASAKAVPGPAVKRTASPLGWATALGSAKWWAPILAAAVLSLSVTVPARSSEASARASAEAGASPLGSAKRWEPLSVPQAPGRAAAVAVAAAGHAAAAAHAVAAAVVVPQAAAVVAAEAARASPGGQPSAASASRALPSAAPWACRRGRHRWLPAPQPAARFARAMRRLRNASP